MAGIVGYDAYCVYRDDRLGLREMQDKSLGSYISRLSWEGFVTERNQQPTFAAITNVLGVLFLDAHVEQLWEPIDVLGLLLSLVAWVLCIPIYLCIWLNSCVT